MNRLIIIGNGFDLAHKYPTKYEDFLLFYFKNTVFAKYQPGVGYDDKLIKLSSGLDLMIHQDFESFGSLWQRILELKSNNNLQVNWPPNAGHLLKEIVENSIHNWVDIEHAYYKLLKTKLPKKGVGNLHSDIIGIQTLNEQFQFMISNLNDYIKRIPPPDSAHNPFYNVFTEDLIGKDGQKPDRTLILNFNYTQTLNPYMSRLKNTIKIDIHGIAGDDNNPIVFGFGDELDRDFQLMEDENIDDYFHYIKKFKYFLNSNYQNLLDFIRGGGKYEIFIVGHSCGLSDRTMLNTLFESKNCVSIKEFHHNTETAYTSKTYSISRHFKNKAAMLDKMVPFNPAHRCPQIGPPE